MDSCFIENYTSRFEKRIHVSAGATSVDEVEAYAGFVKQDEIEYNQFSIPPEQLIQIAKSILSNQSGLKNPELLSGSFFF